MGQSSRPSTVASPATPIPPWDTISLGQIIKVVMAGLIGATGSVSRDNTFTLVHWVKGMRNMGYVSFLGVEDAEIIRHWVQKVDESLVQIHVPVEGRVNCVAQLHSESAHSQWMGVRERRAVEILSWMDFHKQFETRYYSRHYRRKKEREFLAL